MDWVALDFPSIDTTPGLRLINSHLEKNFAQADVIGKLAAGDLRIWDSPLLEHSGFKATMKSNDAPVYP